MAVGLTDELLALDRETGKRVWSFASSAKREDLGLLNASPAILGEQIFFGGFNGILHALDVRSGRILWKQDLGSRVSAGVVADEAGVYVGTSDGRLLLLNPENGEITARITTEGTPTGGLALAGQCLVSLLGEDALACYARSLETVRWIRAGPKPWTSSRPYVWKDLALAGNEAGDVFAFRLADGEIAWSESLGETIRGIGTSSEGLYVGTLKGLVFARPWPRRVGGKSAHGPTFRQ